MSLLKLRLVSAAFLSFSCRCEQTLPVFLGYIGIHQGLGAHDKLREYLELLAYIGCLRFLFEGYTLGTVLRGF